MNQRDRLIELLDRFHWRNGDTDEESTVSMYFVDWECEKIADYLLQNGVIVAPCKIGDTVYDIYEAFHNGGNDVRALKATDIHIHLDKRNKSWIIIGVYYFAIDDFGKTVFLTREEAEKALKEKNTARYAAMEMRTNDL